jgi:enamine deaminase RidA (YjgF/YER057c/UK114 family)
LKKKFVNPPELPKWPQAFSQVVTVSNGGIMTIYLSGQVSVDLDNNVVGGNDLGQQADQAFRNLEIALASVGATTRDVVKINIYIKDYKPEDANKIGDSFRKAFPFENLPASTWLGVQSLALESLLVEIDAIAVMSVKALKCQ